MRTILVILIAIICLPTQVTAESGRPYYIEKNAKKFHLDPDLLLALCSIESRCISKAVNHDDGTQRQKELKIVSKSYGMFQIKLATAKSLGFNMKPKYLLKPEVNTYYACKLLSCLYKKYGSTLKVISAYNADRYVSHNVKYVDKVFRKYVALKIDKRRVK